MDLLARQGRGWEELSELLHWVVAHVCALIFPNLTLNIGSLSASGVSYPGTHPLSPQPSFFLDNSTKMFQGSGPPPAPRQKFFLAPNTVEGGACSSALGASM